MGDFNDAPYQVVDEEILDPDKQNNMLAAIKASLNDIVEEQFASGKLFALAKLKTDGASSGDLLHFDGTDWSPTPPTQAQSTPTGALVPFAGIVAPSGFLLAQGQAISRATFSDLFAVCCPVMSGTLTSGSPVVTTITSTDGLRAGQRVTGNGIPASTNILTVDSATQITLTANATANGAQQLTFFLYGFGDGSTTFNVPDVPGRHMSFAAFRSLGGNILAQGLGGTETPAVAIANRRGGKHQHTPHFHSQGLSDTGSDANNRIPDNQFAQGAYSNTGLKDGGSGVATDPTDGPAEIFVNCLIKT